MLLSSWPLPACNERSVCSRGVSVMVWRMCVCSKRVIVHTNGREAPAAPGLQIRKFSDGGGGGLCVYKVHIGDYVCSVCFTFDVV